MGTPKPIRVLFYAPILGRGGVHRFTVDLLKSLRHVTTPDVLQVFVLGHRFDEWGHPIDWVDDLFTPLEPAIAAQTHSDPDYRFYQLQRYDATWFRQLQLFVDRNQIDIVYLTQPWWSLRVPVDEIKLNAHITLTLFDFAFDTLNWNNSFGDGFRDEARRFARFASHTAFFSAPTRNYALKYYDFAPERTSVIWPGPFVPSNFDQSIENAEAVRIKYKLPEAYFLAFHSAGHKRPSTIIQAAGIVKKMAPEQFRPFVFAGLETENMHPDRIPANPYIAECQRLIIDGKLTPDKDIFFIGRVDDEEIGGLYANAIASISASQSEAGLPGAIFETLKASVPLVYSDIAPHVDRLGKNNEYGLHFKLDDAADCARAITEVLSDYDMARNVAAKAKRDLIDNYSWEDAAQKYVEVFKQLSEQQPVIPPPDAPAGISPEGVWSTQHIKHAQAAPESPIQVLIYAPLVGRGGVRRLVERLLETWLKAADPRRWRFKVLSHAVDEIGNPIDWQSEDILIPLKPALSVQPGDDPTRVFTFLIENQEPFYRQLLLHARNADIVWLPHPWWTLRSSDAESVQIPSHVIPTVHDFGFDTLGWMDAFGEGFRREVRTFTRVASKLIFSSETNMKYAIHNYDMPRNKGETIYLGNFIPSHFHPSKSALNHVQEKHGLPDQFFLAFHAAGHKDPKTIIQAVAILRDKYPNYFYPLVIAGIETDFMIPGHRTDNAYALSVQAMIRSLGLELGKDLYILGYVSDEEVNGLYEAAVACITASRSEAGLSAAVFEAFAAQRPLVFSNLPQFTERLGLENEYGVHFRLGEPQSLAQALVETLHSPEITQARVAKAYQLFVDRTWKDIALDYLQVFEKVARMPLLEETKSVTAPSQSLASGSADMNRQMTMIDSKSPRNFAVRLGTKAKLYTLNRLLPKLNLTSYNALRRVHQMKDELTVKLQVVENELIQTERKIAQLEQQVGDLSTRKSEHLDQVSEALKSAQAELSRMEQQLEVQKHISEQLDEVSSKHAAVQSEVNRLAELLAAETRAKQTVHHQLDFQTRRFTSIIKNPKELLPSSEQLNAATTPIERVVLFQKLINLYTVALESLAVLERIPNTHDDIYKTVLVPLYQEKLGGLRHNFWDIRMALNVLSRIIKPRNYLEVGTRVGWSLAQVVANTPTVNAYCFDNWMTDYAGNANPGEKFVAAQMRQLIPESAELSLSFISGNSHDTLPQFFYPERFSREFDLPLKHPDVFDLITVDGDHTLLGAWWDLDILMSRVAVGGAIVFDDLEVETTTTNEVPQTRYPECYSPMPTNLKSLRDVWVSIKERYPQFVTIETGDQPIAAAVAFRVE